MIPLRTPNGTKTAAQPFPLLAVGLALAVLDGLVVGEALAGVTFGALTGLLLEVLTGLGDGLGLGLGLGDSLGVGDAVVVTGAGTDDVWE